MSGEATAVFELPMFPLQSALLPGETLPLRIFEPRYTQLVRDCLAADEPEFGVVLITHGREVGGGDIRGDVGVLVRITDCVASGEGQYQLLAEAGERIRVRQWLTDDPYPRAEVQRWPDDPGEVVPAERIGEVVDGILALYHRVAAAAGRQLRPDALAVDPETADDQTRHVYTLAARVPMGQADRYAVLSAPDLATRIDVVNDAVETVTAMVEFQLSDE